MQETHAGLVARPMYCEIMNDSPYQATPHYGECHRAVAAAVDGSRHGSYGNSRIGWYFISQLWRGTYGVKVRNIDDGGMRAGVISTITSGDMTDMTPRALSVSRHTRLMLPPSGYVRT